MGQSGVVESRIARIDRRAAIKQRVSLRGTVAVGQFTKLQIGNTGCNADDAESVGSAPQVAGFVMRDACDEPSNWRSEESLHKYLERHGIVAPVVTWGGEVMGGARVAEAYEAGEFQMLCAYCAADVEACRQLYMALTANDTRGTFVLDDTLDAQLAEIVASDMPSDAKKLAAYDAAANAGLVPRIA